MTDMHPYEALKIALQEARDERDDWRESATRAAGESCGDERHCTCVGPLRKELRDAKAKLAALATACSTWQEWGGHCDTCEFVRQRAANTILDTALFADYCDCGWHATREALAAAKEQP